MMPAQGEAGIEDHGDHLRVTLWNPGRSNALAPSMNPVLRAGLDHAVARGAEPAAGFARGPAAGQAANKRLLAGARGGDFGDQFDREAGAMADALAGPEAAAAGLSARLNRTAPGFGRGSADPQARAEEEEINR